VVRINKSKELIPSIRPDSASVAVRRILAYIDRNYNRSINLSDAALLVGLHPQHLCRKFKREVGISIQKYLLRVRIRVAICLLAQSYKSVKEIGYELGFYNPEIFSKSFKRLTGVSPKNYRIQMKRTRR
jgi:two-component system response regulator YesN